MRRRIPICCLVALLSLSTGATVAPAASTIDHASWDHLLKTYVKHGQVDYRGVASERATLDQYLATIAAVTPAQLPSRAAQLAFWINAYNACVVSGVLDHYPLTSVKNIKGFFDNIRYTVGGEQLTLNAIEARGRALGDWRMHFAVVCASSSCPAMRAEAYVADRLEAQLAEQTRQFLADPQRGIRIEEATLWVSKIFEWYTTDFVPAKELGLFRRLTPEQLLSVLAPYLTPEMGRAVRQRTLTLKFLNYDWSLNAQRRGRP